MSSLSLREAALAAVSARLVALLSDVTVERSRRAPVDTSSERLPRLVVRGEDMQADESAEPDRTHYSVTFSVTGYVAAATDLAAEQALSQLQARVVAAFRDWAPITAGLSDVSEIDTAFSLYDVEDSARPAGEFTTRFSILAVGPSGGPWSS